MIRNLTGLKQLDAAGQNKQTAAKFGQWQSSNIIGSWIMMNVVWLERGQ